MLACAGRDEVTQLCGNEFLAYDILIKLSLLIFLETQVVILGFAFKWNSILFSKYVLNFMSKLKQLYDIK